MNEKLKIYDEKMQKTIHALDTKPVSYTHLTLPTIA